MGRGTPLWPLTSNNKASVPGPYHRLLIPLTRGLIIRPLQTSSVSLAESSLLSSGKGRLLALDMMQCVHLLQVKEETNGRRS